MRSIRDILVLVLVGVASATPAHAQAPLFSGLGGPEDFGPSCLHPNDDGSSLLIDLTPAFPAGLRFFDEVHTSAYVNTNGNITFSGALSTFTPNPFPVAARPMIAPFWADVDIRREGTCTTGTTGTCENPSEDGVWWYLEPGRMVVTWDDTGYFSCHEDKVMTFQLILTAVPSCGGGATDFNVEFRFNQCEWETGDASGGAGGFGGTEAQSGFDAGNSRDFIMLPGSRMPGISNLLCTDSNIGEAGVWRFQIRSGTVLCPDAGEPCSTGMVGTCAEGVSQCVGVGTECQPVVPSSDEGCDALDNDCDGSVDEGDLCGGDTAICDRGVCVDLCFEGGCGAGQVCTDAGRCVDAGCEDVAECPAGERCVAGSCVGACADIVCPTGQDCQAGRCLDLCADLSCDVECSTCVAGECVPRCDGASSPCEAGETCLDDGSCMPTSCVGVDCMAGSVCVEGSGCVDACDDAVCPNGEVCRVGECVPDVPEMSMDGGVDGGDAGDAGGDAGGDASGDARAAEDAGTTPARRSGGCGCVTSGTSGGALPLASLALLALVGLARSRRRG